MRSNMVLQQANDCHDGPINAKSLARMEKHQEAVAPREVVRITSRLGKRLQCKKCSNHHHPQAENAALQKEAASCVLICFTRKVRHVLKDTKCKTRLNWISHVWYNFRSYHFGVKRDLSLSYDSRSYALNFERDLALEAYREKCRKTLPSVA